MTEEAPNITTYLERMRDKTSMLESNIGLDIAIFRNLFYYPTVDALIEQTDWEQQTMFMYGKFVKQPRLTCWYGDKEYKYSGLLHKPKPMTPLLEVLKEVAERISGNDFNSCLLNLYRDGNDSIGFHSDDEKELGKNPVIASLSFGATRRLVFKHKKGEYPDKTILLEDGSMLVMFGKTQESWKHGIEKELVQTPRVNITFRKVIQ